MKKLLVLFSAMFSICGYAQNLSVAGVSLMDDYSKVERILEDRYGITYYKEHNEIKYFDITIGGMFFESATFKFVYNPRTSDRRLNAVFLSNHYELSDVNSAKAFRDRAASVYSQKYSDIDSYTKDDGFKIYRCALDYSREIYLILIDLEKSKSKGGDMFYYVTVSYGPAYKESTDDI